MTIETVDTIGFSAEGSDGLVFVHLSDIHFSTKSGSPDDLDDVLRKNLLRDVVAVCAPLGKVSAVLVSGDIAGHGKDVEYEYARDWLDQLCGVLAIGTENVVTIPGNHDIDRTQQDSDLTARMAREKLRAAGKSDDQVALDQAIAEVHADGPVRSALYRPLTNCNKFALPYAIDEDTRWFEETYLLNDGSELRVRGVNSVLVSDETDDLHTSKLVVGTTALSIPEEDNVTYLLMCHHPPRWVYDKVVDGPVAAHAKIQLFGHEHEQTVIRFRDSARIFSGALHPERKPAWQPQYNVIKVRVDGTGATRVLNVDVLARMWSAQSAHFGPDNAVQDGKHHFAFALPARSPSAASVMRPAKIVSVGEPAEDALPVPGREVDVMDANSESRRPDRVVARASARQLAHRFYRLPIPKQWGIVRRLGYDELKGTNASSAAFFEAVFSRAKAEGKLAELWTLVQIEYGETETANPFAVGPE